MYKIKPTQLQKMGKVGFKKPVQSAHCKKKLWTYAIYIRISALTYRNKSIFT